MKTFILWMLVVFSVSVTVFGYDVIDRDLGLGDPGLKSAVPESAVSDTESTTQPITSFSALVSKEMTDSEETEEDIEDTMFFVEEEETLSDGSVLNAQNFLGIDFGTGASFAPSKDSPEYEEWSKTVNENFIFSVEVSNFSFSDIEARITDPMDFVPLAGGRDVIIFRLSWENLNLDSIAGLGLNETKNYRCQMAVVDQRGAKNGLKIVEVPVWQAFRSPAPDDLPFEKTEGGFEGVTFYDVYFRAPKGVHAIWVRFLINGTNMTESLCDVPVA
ncbi:MAG: hypothetical protein PHS07_03090 [Patescibacteria group bacterium]|nr:hypothetical protein [Patescibacteria group bacterium]